MAVIIIDQKSYEVDEQKNLLESAISLGLDLPYFCWHPGLGSVGACRLCAVQQFADDNDTKGRTVMACMTQAKDNLKFSINHPICTDFRKEVIEWLMINHPHDCPVCDEGGECHLQDMTLMAGHNYRTYRFKKRTFKNQNLGPFINHEMNRCITCYRCVRYYKDLAGGTDLSAFSSSGRVYFGRFAEGSLDNEFSGNLVEVCPTGVFTDKVFHQRYTRKWDLATAPSVCQLCSVGCNISPGERGGILRRVQNRYHHDINGYFICDRGRFGHDFVNFPDRLKQPLIKREGHLIATPAEEALAFVRSLISQSKNVIGIGSPRASLEANWLLKQWVSPDNFYDGLSKTDSQTMNSAVDCLIKGVPTASLKDIREADAILILGEDVTNTAPMIALSIRQAVMSFKQTTAQKDLGITLWNDAAVKDYARDILLPIHLANIFDTALDNIAYNKCIVHPFDLEQLVLCLIKSMRDEQYESTLAPAQQYFINQVKESLMAAKKPVIIAGTSLGQESLIRAGAELTLLLNANHQAKLALVLPEANSVGLGLLKPKPLSLAFNAKVDAAIILENDLNFRLGDKPWQTLANSIENIIVIDSLPTTTMKLANVVLPCETFFESTGSLVNAEGRLQRFFSVANGCSSDLMSSAHLLAFLMGKEDYYKTIDDIDALLAKDIDIMPEVFDHLFVASFKVDGKPIARQTSEYSGRTAKDTHISMHEPKPKADKDSPLVYSMEGATRKIPLPLISSPWRSRWNSIQASFRLTLNTNMLQKDAWGGVRIFANNNIDKNNQPTFIEKTTPRDPMPKEEVYIVPRHHIFGSSERAHFSSLATSAPRAEVELSESEAMKHGFGAGATIVINSRYGQFSLLAKTNKDLPPGILVLPFGQVDAALFFESCTFRVVSEQSV